MGIGVICCMAGSNSQQQALSVSGATVPRVFGQRGQVAACAVGEGQVLNRARGYVDPNDAFVAVGAPAHSGAAAAQSADQAAPSTRPGYFKHGHRSFARHEWFESSGSSRTAG